MYIIFIISYKLYILEFHSEFPLIHYFIHNNIACLHKKLNKKNKNENEHDSLIFLILKGFFSSYCTFEYLT